MQVFRISAVASEDSCRLSLSGEADLDFAGDIVELGVASLDDPAVSYLIVDLHGVTYIDSTAIGALVQLRNLAEVLGKQLVLDHVPLRVHNVLAITGLDRVFVQDNTDAMNGSSPHPGIAGPRAWGTYFYTRERPARP